MNAEAYRRHRDRMAKITSASAAASAAARDIATSYPIPRRAFTDNRGRRWVVRLDENAAKAIRESYPDLLLMPPAELVATLAADVERLVCVLWACCASEAERLGVSPEAFAAGLADGIISDATDALIGELKRVYRIEA